MLDDKIHLNITNVSLSSPEKDCITLDNVYQIKLINEIYGFTIEYKNGSNKK